MRAGDLCRKPIVSAPASTPVGEISRLMRTHHVGSVVVTAGNGARTPVGILTDRDIVVEVLAMGLDAASLTAGDVMTASPATVPEDEDALWTLKVMRDRGVRRLPVVKRDGELAGMIALDDLMQYLAGTLGDVVQLIGTERSVEGARRA